MSYKWQKFEMVSDCMIMMTAETHDGKLIVEHKQHNIDEILKKNKDIKSCDDNGFNVEKGFHLQARVPMIVHHEWIKKGFDMTSHKNCKPPMNKSEHSKELKRRLNDPDNQAFRTCKLRM